MKNLFIITLLLSSLLSFGQTRTLSNDAEISILTCSPGPQLHEIFGHSAIRFHDDKNHIDWVFNYGTFRFDTPNFYVKFVRGNLDYMLAATNYKNFINAYKDERSVYEQTLNLDSISKQKIFDAIIINYKPENKYYKYEFQLDNCATRIRDIVDDNVSSTITYGFPDQDKTFRDILKEYLVPIRWTDWGINTLLGRRLDHMASTKDYMYIPDYVMHLYDSASINNEPLVRTKKIIQAPQTIFPTPWYFGPELAFCLLFVLVLAYSVRCIKKKRISRWIDYILFSVVGLVGIVLFFMCFFSDYNSTAWNYNLLFFTPTHLIALFFLHKRESVWLKRYFWLCLIACFHAIGLFYLLPIGGQALPWASLPLILIISLRSYMIAKNK